MTLSALRLLNVPLIALGLTWSSASAAQGTPPLRVIRSSPNGEANPLAQITVTFDRPVAGSLDRMVDAASVLRVEPAIPGKLEWRDPVTIRLVPSSTLVPGRTYAVTVSNTFRAMDGGVLQQPFKFSFRAKGPILDERAPIASEVSLNHRFEVTYSAPVDLDRLSAAAYMEFAATCSATRVFRLRASAQRPAPPRYYGDDESGAPYNAHLDSLRRVVRLVPEAALPRACKGDLVLPKEIGEPNTGLARMPFSTYGDFRIRRVECERSVACPNGPFIITFTTPVRGAEVLRRARILPETKFVLRDTVAESTMWVLEATLKPRVAYAVVVDTAIRDVFGQSLLGNPAAGYRTTGVAPIVNAPYGHLVVERSGFKTLSVQLVNIDTLVAIVAPVPESLEPEVMSRFGWARDTIWTTLMSGVKPLRIPVNAPQDRAFHMGVHISAPDARRPGAPTLYAVKVAGRAAGADISADGPISIVQVTNLGVHARIGASDGAVWVTGADDGLPRAGAIVVLHDTKGKALATARTDARGLARFSRWTTPPPHDSGDALHRDDVGRGYVKVTLGSDRAIANVSEYDDDLSPWHFNVEPAWDRERLPVAGAVFTERGIYRPGERVYAKAIVRDGLLGALRVPAPGDSIRWQFQDREGQPLQEATVALSSFGTSSRSYVLPAVAAIGQYRVDVQLKRFGRWRTVGQTNYRVAEYRPPEFLVDANAKKAMLFPGDTFAVAVQARYLFGAPMGRAVVGWIARQTPVYSLDLDIPGTDGWNVGDNGSWWEESSAESDRVFANGADTLDARGERTLKVALPPAIKGRAANVTVSTVVTDVNRQTVMASTTTIVHPADFYLAAKPRGADYFWKAGESQTIDVIAVRPTGERVTDAAVQGTIVRREWHQVRRERDGESELVGSWVSDTVAHCAIVTASAPVACAFTPREGGAYTVGFLAHDRAGRAVTTSIMRWAAGSDWIPWNDESQFKMDVIPDKTRYTVGDTATVLFASPFTNAEAWVTVEREGIIQQQRLRITSGATTLKFPITEAFAPNAFISITVARGRSAKPGPLDDPGRPTIRVGYVKLRVTPEVKRLRVTVAPEKPEYLPGDSARVRVGVHDALGHGALSEVTLWGVDEGVLSLTGYKTPDPIDLVYRERGLGVRLASNITTVAPQVPDGTKGQREPGGGGGAAGADVLRSRFQTTAFFLGSVVTDAQGNAVVVTRLPDNLTTFRVMAVAVTRADRYGSGESKLLVTRPLVARPALPRFVRPGDRFTAGAVINRRDGTAATVVVRASSVGATLSGSSDRTVQLAEGRGAEVRFPFLATRVDSAAFRIEVSGGGFADAVRTSIPTRPDYAPRVHALAGVLRDTATVEIALPDGLDPARSRLSVQVGVSPLPIIRGMALSLIVYPYDCSEQVVSEALPIIALYRAQRLANTRMLRGDPRAEIQAAVAILSRRQRADGGIGYWSPGDWSSGWLSAYAGIVMLDARDLGIKVDSGVLARLGDYLTRSLHGKEPGAYGPITEWYGRTRILLADHVAAVDFLSRSGRADIAAENDLLRTAAMMAIEDRARLAEVLARRKQTAAATQLMNSVWNVATVEGRRAIIPDSVYTPFYFESFSRPIARILTATLAVDPAHALIGPLVETLVQQTRRGHPEAWWNSQDFGSAISALAAYDRALRAQPERPVRLRLQDNSVITLGAAHDSSLAVTGLISGASGARVLRASLRAGPGESAVYYYLAVTEVPSTPPVTPDDKGIKVERWYERLESGVPVTTVTEGDLVRVRLRVTVDATRQFLALDDALPAGMEAIDLSLRTASAMPGPSVSTPSEEPEHEERDPTVNAKWSFGLWDSGWWTPFDHHELRDDRVTYFATLLWPGTYTASYIARATTPGTFVKPPAHAEEMYNPGVNGRSDGGTFVVLPRGGGKP